MKHLLEILDRAARTAAQAAGAMLVGDWSGFLDVPWTAIGSVAALAAIGSILSSVGVSGFGLGTPSLVESPNKPTSH